MAKEDPEYLAWLRTLPCAAREEPFAPKLLTPCGGATHAHHRTGAGMSLKAHDHEAMPLCMLHHHELHTLSGAFKTARKKDLAAWQDGRVRHYRYLKSFDEYVDDEEMPF